MWTSPTSLSPALPYRGAGAKNRSGPPRTCRLVAHADRNVPSVRSICVQAFIAPQPGRRAFEEGPEVPPGRTTRGGGSVLPPHTKGEPSVRASTPPAGLAGPGIWRNPLRSSPRMTTRRHSAAWRKPTLTTGKLKLRTRATAAYRALPRFRPRSICAWAQLLNGWGIGTPLLRPTGEPWIFSPTRPTSTAASAD